MSTRDIGAIETTKSTFDRTSAWVFALILAVLFVVSLIATTDPGTRVDRAPAAPAFVIGDQLAGGPSTVNHGAPTGQGAAWQPVVIGDTVCHQCR